MKKTGVFCVALASVLALSAALIGTRQFADPAYAVLTPCGDIDTSSPTGPAGGGNSSGSDSVTSEGTAIGNGTVEAGQDVSVTVYDKVPSMATNGPAEWETNKPTVQLDINYKALSCLEIYDNGVLVTTVPVTPSFDWQNVKPVFDLENLGMHNITVYGYDLNGDKLSYTLDYKIKYDPNYLVPPTGVIKIGELEISKIDLISIISAFVVACGVFTLLVILKNRKQEAGARVARRR